MPTTTSGVSSLGSRFATTGAPSLRAISSKVAVHWIEPARPPGSSSVRTAKIWFVLLDANTSSRLPLPSMSASVGA